MMLLSGLPIRTMISCGLGVNMGQPEACGKLIPESPQYAAPKRQEIRNTESRRMSDNDAFEACSRRVMVNVCIDDVRGSSVNEGGMRHVRSN